MDTLILDAVTCYRALVAADPRFDGRFFAGVVTTGIYCRPVCRAPKPKAQNVRYFLSAAAAAQAGFRPCLRCRPESAPGSTGWRGTSATVARALRLIGAGALERGGIEQLSADLGLGSRQLRRLFVEHLGAPPLAVAKTQRIHFAKKLIDETRLPMVDVALSAGFSSVRRFNAAMRQAYERPPTRLRRERRQGTAPASEPGLELRLAFREPYDWDGLLAFLAPRCTPGVERVEGGTYHRTIRLGECAGILAATVRPGAGFLALNLDVPDPTGLHAVVQRARRMFDLDADPEPIADQLRSDPAIGRLVAACPGRRVPGAWDGFELAVRAILGQQITVRGATTLAGRIARGFGRPLARATASGLTHHFPTAEELAAADLDGIGLPRDRARSIVLLARAVRDGALEWSDRARPEVATARLLAIPGIGDWTAQYVAMRALGEPDAFPAGDLGLRRAIAGAGGTPTARALARLAESWRPWRAYAAMHLWASLGGSNEPKEKS